MQELTYSVAALEPRHIAEHFRRMAGAVAGGPLRGAVSEGTHVFYEYRACTYLIPAFGRVPLRDLTAEHLEGLYADLLRGVGTPSGKPLAPTTVGHIHSTARTALWWATKKG
jgi:hypothetical protein